MFNKNDPALHAAVPVPDQEVIPHLSPEQLSEDLDSFLTAAVDCAEALAKQEGSRDLSCVITKLHEAEMWMQRDRAMKALDTEGGR